MSTTKLKQSNNIDDNELFWSQNVKKFFLLKDKITKDDMKEYPFLFQELKIDFENNFKSLPLNDAIRFLEETVICVIHIWNKMCGSDSTTMEVNEATQHLHKILKQISSSYQDNDVCSFKKKRISSHPQFCQYILQICCSDDIPIDLRNTCGLLSIQMFLIIQEVTSFYKLYYRIVTRIDYFENVTLLGEVALYHGIICCCSLDHMFTYSTLSENLSHNLLQRVLQIISEDLSKNGSAVLLSCRLLNHLILRLNDYLSYMAKEDIPLPIFFISHYNIYSRTTNNILELFWILWDHYLDSAKHLARESFSIFVKFHQNLDKRRSGEFFSDISKDLAVELPYRKYAFSALSVIVPLLSVGKLIKFRDGFLIDLVKLLSDPSYATHSITLLESMFVKHAQEVDSEIWKATWHSLFFDNFSHEMLTYGFESIFEKFLLTGSSNIPSVIEEIIANNQKATINQLSLLMMCTKIAAKHNKTMKIYGEELPDENNSTDTKDFMWKQILPFYYIQSCLNSPDDSLKLLAFNLLTDNSKSTKLYHKQELQALFNFINNNINHQAAAFRQKFLNNVKKLLNRINKGCLSKIKASKDKGTTIPLVLMHEEFSKDLFLQMSFNLHCSANHPRVTTSLQIIQMILDILLNKKSQPSSAFCHLRKTLLTVPLCDSLLVCLWDSYELNKQFALNILRNSCKECPNLWQNISSDLLETASQLSTSSRPLDSLTACYLFNAYFVGGLKFTKSQNDCPKYEFCLSLVKELNENVEVAKKSLMLAASKAPMYGKILCLKTILADEDPCHFVTNSKNWSLLLKELVDICIQISITVSPIVKNSSPEGHLPSDFNLHSETVKSLLNNSLASREKGLKKPCQEDSDQVTKAHAVTAQMILLCGWRNIKEISLLFGFLVQTFSQDQHKLLSHESMETIGDFFMNQLFETKHRGAFEQAYTGFLQVCASLWKNPDEKLSVFPENWLRATLFAIEDENDSRLCSTRRSAGVPYIIQAILITEPSIRGSLLFRYTMTFFLLKGKSEDSSMESRLHSFNILRALYKETRLGEAVVPFVCKGVNLAIDGYKHCSWNIRNAATLLFSSLVTRMLGVKRSHDDLHSKNSVSAFLFFKRYPALYDLFLHEMKENMEQMQLGKLTASTYPTLLILARFTPVCSIGYSTTIDVSPFIPLVLYLNSSPVLQLRQLSSKALVPLVTESSITDVIEKLNSSLMSEKHNEVHGSMLCYHKLFNKYSKSQFIWRRIPASGIENIHNSIVNLTTETNSCFVTKCAALHFLEETGILSLSPNLKRRVIVNCTSMLVKIGKSFDKIPGSFLCLEQATSLYLQLCNPSQIATNLQQLFNHPSPEVHSAVYKYIATMESPTENIIQGFVEIILRENTSVDAQILLYEVLFKILSHSKNESLVGMTDDNLVTILNTILRTLGQDLREDLIAQKLLISAKIVERFLQLGIKGAVSEMTVENLCNTFSCFSTCDNSSFVRTMASKSVVLILPFISLAFESEKCQLILLTSVLETLVDDDVIIRNIVCEGVLKFLNNHPSKLDTLSDSLSPQDCLLALIQFLVCIDSEKAIGLTIQFAIKEEVIDEFGLAQEDDRAFEKGETKVFREDVMLAKDVADVLASKVDSITTIDVSMFEEFLLSYGGEEIDNNGVTVYRFLQILRIEIQHILKGFAVFKEKTLFSLKHFNVWISRLARRALLWKAFESAHAGQRIESDSLKVLLESSLKPIIICDIYDWLNC